MNDLMIDIETLSTAEDAVVISIGACFFNKEGIGPTFSMNFKIDDQLEKRTIDGPTLKWWMNQEHAARKVFNEQAAPSDVVCKMFAAWVLANANIEGVRPWGNGATFDITIVENLLRQYNVEVPWKFWNVRDLRTFREYVGNNEKIVKTGINHVAIDDAIAQAEYVMKYTK